jgi:hypothetical protein
VDTPDGKWLVMATLKLVGTPAQWDVQAESQYDPATLSFLNLILSQNMTMPQVTALIAADLSSYATLVYQNNAIAGTAGPNTSQLATPAWTNTQVANHVPSNTVGQVNGPVGLGSASSPTPGQVSPGLINAVSTQQWPSPFWSPASYQAAAVTASTTPAQLYTASMPYPGYTYTLACFGMIDTSVAADDGTIPEVLVRVGSITGQIIAFGYGCGEYYLGPTPGDTSSQAFINSAFTTTGSWATISNWIAQNTGGYSSVMVGNYLQVPDTMTATVSASVVFSGAVASSKKTVSTSIQLVNNAGTIIATGAAVTGVSGTCTVSWSSGVTFGQLYGIQVAETGASTFAQISSGTFTITSSTVGNVGPANIIPVPFEDQTPLTAAATLYVMLQSSNSSTAVTASTFDPGLWICPIPWA